MSLKSILPAKNTLIHIPVGLVNVFFLWFSIPLGLLFGMGFLAYELKQGGKPHLDIQSWLWGLGIGGVIWCIIHWLYLRFL